MTLPFDPWAITKSDLYGAGVGVTSQTFRIQHTGVLAKAPAPSPIFGTDVHAIEKKVYERLGNGHPNILKCLGHSPPDCRLLQKELLFEYHTRGMLAACLDQWKDVHARVRSVVFTVLTQGMPFLSSCNELIFVPSLREQWPFQAVSAVAYIHSHDIVHADLGLHNFLLGRDGSIVLCDFAGSSIDGCNSQVAPGIRYANPLFTWSYPNKMDDIFSLETALYELDRGERLYPGLSDEEIVRRFKEKRFPDLDDVSIPVSGVIERCWTQDGYTASEALRALGLLHLYNGMFNRSDFR
ncbi:serine/threonine protein kinase [Blastomyces percursus]|uniref:Serine/threonine protein kinase n=1 Tax=Blastomyces percursus TaxID=1658174 RepID=A0A1J9QYX2_9EURO|nr:serine/threonine protein kinase [Blastomyces percursus]